MTISNSRLSYTDCYSVFDSALEDPNGVRVKVTDFNAAIHMRMRLHQARAISRRDNMQTFGEDHPLYGRSVYDKFVVRIRRDDEDFYIYIEPVEKGMGSVESLSEIEGEFEEVKYIEEEKPKLLENSEITRRRL